MMNKAREKGVAAEKILFFSRSAAFFRRKNPLFSELVGSGALSGR
ncbi:hypothetical protein LTSEUGA_3078 [Salmonella enterica subsp. enterica serovar Uganda str. R8-3404]|nr:hypothetical protein LTSEUGA_3078 [Salmonella enterica subsp. enterica serovar Uganda str. R8-3404]